MTDTKAVSQVVNIETGRKRLRSTNRAIRMATATQAASYLESIATLLRIPIENFYEEAPSKTPPITAEIIELVQAYCAIKCPHERRIIINAALNASNICKNE